MPPPPQPINTSQEARITLAIQALQKDASLSLRRAAKDYNVPQSTLCERRQGTVFQSNSHPQTMKLTQSEEQAITKNILELDSRGFSPTPALLRDMANKLLAERHQKPVGINWPTNFIQRNPELKTRWNHTYNCQQALNKKPEIIKNWFDLVRQTKEQYGIIDEDITNFDETGFCMGYISAHMVITASEKRHSKAKTVQPGNCEWITVIQSVSASG